MSFRMIDAHAVELLGLRYDYKVVEIVVSYFELS